MAKLDFAALADDLWAELYVSVNPPGVIDHTQAVPIILQWLEVHFGDAGPIDLLREQGTVSAPICGASRLPDRRYVVDATNLSRAQCCGMMHFWHNRAKQADGEEQQRMLACADGWKKAAEKARLNTPIIE